MNPRKWHNPHAGSIQYILYSLCLGGYFASGANATTRVCPNRSIGGTNCHEILQKFNCAGVIRFGLLSAKRLRHIRQNLDRNCLLLLLGRRNQLAEAVTNSTEEVSCIALCSVR